MTSRSDIPGRSVDEVRKLLDTGDTAPLLAFVAGVASPLERRQLLSVAQQTLSKRKDASRSLDALIEVARAGVAEGLRQAASETDPAEAAKRRDFVQQVSFDLAADLAECWPDDLTPRARRHFEAGLAAASDAVRLRDELGKPPGARAAACWVRGAHELSLGRAKDAAPSFERALDFARRAAKGAPAAVVPGGDVQVILASGALGLATGTSLFEDACTALDATAVRLDREAAEPVEFAAAQLRWFAGRLRSPDRAADLKT
jgi:hypothetical protein